MTYKFKHATVFFTILIFIQSLSLLGQSDWELAKEKDGIKVYLRSYKGGKLKELKAITKIKCSLHTLNAVFKDVTNCKNWMSDIGESTLLKQMPDGTLYKYFVVNVPFPLKNRDIIYHEHSVQDPHDKSITFKSVSVPDFHPEKDGLVRMLESESLWKFTPKGNGDIEIVHQLYADPSGIPSWIVNMLMVDGPIGTINKLKKEVLKDQFKNKKYNYIQE